MEISILGKTSPFWGKLSIFATISTMILISIFDRNIAPLKGNNITQQL